jgi:hypothetical protein
MRRGADDGGPGRPSVVYSAAKPPKSTSAAKAKKHAKGAKGGIGCEVEGGDGPIDQGSNRRVDLHAEKQGFSAALKAVPRPVSVNMRQSAWPCWHCHEWLRLAALHEGVTITVTATSNRYIEDHKTHPRGGENTVIYHPDGRFEYVTR